MRRALNGSSPRTPRSCASAPTRTARSGWRRRSAPTRRCARTARSSSSQARPSRRRRL